MNYRKTILLVSIIFYPFIFYAQSPKIEWEHSYGSSQQDLPLQIKHTKDGGYVVVGFVQGNDGDVKGNHGSTDAWIIKIDASGKLLWQKCIGGSSVDGFSTLLLLNNGNYLVGGSTSSTNGDATGNHEINGNAWLTILDSAGNVVKKNFIGGSYYDEVSEIVQLNNGKFMAVGSTRSNDGDIKYNHGSNDILLMKIDANLNLEWEKTYGGIGDDYEPYIASTYDSGFVISATTTSNDGDVNGEHGGKDAWVFRVNDTGKIIWQRCFGGSADEEAGTVQQTFDSCFVFAVTSTSTDGDFSDVGPSWSSRYVESGRIYKLDDSGKIKWSTYIDGEGIDVATCVRPTVDGCIVFGSTTSDIFGRTVSSFSDSNFFDCYAAKLDKSGKIVWGKTLGGDLNDASMDGILTDGGYIVCAYAESIHNGDVSGGYGGDDFWIVKINDPLSTSNTLEPEQDIKVYPTYTKGNVSLKLPTGFTDAQIKLYNEYGSPINFVQNGNNLSSFSFPEGTPPGLYILNIINNKRKYSFKIVYSP